MHDAAAALPLQAFALNNQSRLDTLNQSMFAVPGPRGAQTALCSDCCGSNGNSCETPES